MKKKVWNRVIATLLMAMMLVTEFNTDALVVWGSEADEIQSDIDISESSSYDEAGEVSQSEDNAEDNSDQTPAAEETVGETTGETITDDIIGSEEETVPAESPETVDDLETEKAETEGPEVETSEAEIPEAEDTLSADDVFVVSGKLIMPADSYTTKDISGGIYMYYEQYSSKSTSFTIPAYDNRNALDTDEPVTVDYSITLPKKIDSLMKIYLYFNSSDSQTNLPLGKYIYLTEDGWTYKSPSVLSLQIPSSGAGLDFTLPKAKVYGTIKLPENVEISGTGYYSGTIYAEVDNSNYSMYFNVRENDREIPYVITSVPLAAEKIDSIKIRLDTNSYMDSNLTLGLYEYYDGTKLTTDESKAVGVDFSDDGTLSMDFTLTTTRLSGSFDLPENSFRGEEDIRGYIRAYYDDGGWGDYAQVNFSVKPGDSSVKYYMNKLPIEVDKLSYLMLYVYDCDNETNLIYGQSEYYNGQDFVTDESAKAEVSLPAQGLDLAIKPCLSRWHVVVSPAGDLMLQDGKIKGYMRFTGKVGTDSRTYSCQSRVALDKDSSVDLYLNELPYEMTTISNIRVCWERDDTVETSTITDKELYFDGTKWVPQNTDCSVALPEDFSAVNIPVTKADKVAYFTVALPEGDHIYGEPLKGYVRFYTGSYDGYGRDFYIRENETQKTFCIGLPDVEKVRVYLNINENNYCSTAVLTGEFYYASAGLVTKQNSAEEVLIDTQASQSSPLRINLQKSKNLNLELRLPENGYVEEADLEGSYARIFVNHRSYYTSNFKIKKSENKGNCTFALGNDQDATEITQLFIYLRNNKNSATNLVTNKNLYFNGTGLSYSEDDSASIPLTSVDNSLSVTLPKVKSINGSLTMPEGTFIRNGEVKVGIYARDDKTSYYQDFTISSPDSPKTYHLALGADSERVSGVYLYVNVPSGVETNLATGTWYLGSNGKLQSSSSDSKTIGLTASETTQDIQLIKAPSVQGSIKLPEGTYFRGGNLQGTLDVYTDKGSRSFNINASEGSNTIPYLLILPAGSTMVRYFSLYFNKNSSVETNLTVQRYQYCDLSGSWSMNTNDMRSSDIAEDEIDHDICLPAQKEITGTIKIPDSISAIDEKLTGKITFTGSNSSNSYVADIEINKGEKAADYTVFLPGAESRITKIQLNINNPSVQTDILTGDMYYISDGNWSRSYSECSLNLSDQRNEFNVELPYKRTLSGNIILPKGMIVNGGEVNGTIEALVGSQTKTAAFTVKNTGNDDLSYNIELPEGTGRIDRLSVILSANSRVTTNLLTGTTYYNAEKHTWVSSYLNATAMTLDAANTVLDVEIKKAVDLSGRIALSSGEFFNNASLTGYVRVYIGENFYAEYFEIPVGKTSVDYRIRLPFESDRIDRIQLMVYKNSFRESNILAGTDMYYTGSDEQMWSVNLEQAASIPLNGEGIVLNLSLPESNSISGRVIADERYENVSGTLGIIAGNSEYKTVFNTSDGGAYVLELPPGLAQTYRLFYRLDDDDSDIYATGTIYVDKDGSYEIIPEETEEETIIKGVNRRDIKLALWDDLTKVAPLIESSHPYVSGRDQEITYEYPGEADSLTLHFSKCTCVEENFDEIQIFDGNGNSVGSYTGTQLAGSAVKVPGNAMRIVISPDDSRSLYGFGIDSIDVENGIGDGQTGASVVVCDGVPSAAIIHNTSNAEKSFYMTEANYSETGRMIGISTKNIKVGTGMASCKLELKPSEKSSYGKLMLYDEKLAPVCENRYKSNPQYAVTFDNNDGTGFTRSTYLAAGDTIKEPTVAPSRPGYRFKGWYLSSAAKDEEKYVFGSGIDKSIVLYAGWTKAYYVSIDIDGMGQVESDGTDSGYALPGTSITLLAKPDEHWKTGGWKARVFSPGEGVNAIRDEDLVYDEETGALGFVMPQGDVYLDVTFVRSVEVNWTSTGIPVNGNKDLLFDDNRLIVPDDMNTVNLRGDFNQYLRKEDIESLKYRYSYYSKDDEGSERYTEGTFENIALLGDDTGFEISGLHVGVGTNLLEIELTARGETTDLTYYIIGTGGGVSLNEDVHQLDVDEDRKTIESFSTGIAAYWNYDNGTPDTPDDDKIVMILDKLSEMAVRLMSDPGDEDHLEIGDVWIIPSCEQFPSGFAFRIDDFGDAEYAPTAPEGDVYEGTEFSSDKYLYLLASNPDISDLLSDSMALSADGVGGVAFSLLPRNSMMSCDLEYDDGSIASAEVGDLYGEDELMGAGFQFQDLITNIVANAGMKGGKADVSIKFKDTVLYDEDGDKDTKWDQLKLGGEVSLSDFDVSGAFEWHPIKEGRVLPSQIGVLAEYTQTESVKLTLGGEVRETDVNGKEEDKKEDKKEEDKDKKGFKLSNVVKSFKDQFGVSDNKRDISFLGMDYSLSGVDMDSTIVLAAIGFNLITETPTPAGYEGVVATSKACGIEPILVFMVCLDVDGSISAQVSYEYKKESYNAKGFNVMVDGYRGTDDTIAAHTPSKTKKGFGYTVDIYSTTQKSVTEREEPHGKHTITAKGEATLSLSVTGRMGLMLSGIDVAEVKAGIYADAGIGFEGSIVMEKGKETERNFDGYVDGSIGFIAGYDINVSIGPKDDHSLISGSSNDTLNISGKATPGISFSDEFKQEFFHFGYTLIGVSGVVKEPARSLGGDDTPLSGVNITLTSKNKFKPLVKTIETDAEGKYSFRGLSAGSYELVFKKDGYVEKKETVEIAGKSEKKNVFMPEAKYMGLVGTVVKNGAPLKGAGLTLVPMYDPKNPKYARTDDEGKFSYDRGHSTGDGLTPGVYKLTVTSRGNKPVDIMIEVVYNDTGILDLGTIEAVDGAYGSGTVAGIVCDLSTGRKTGTELTLYLRKGANNVSGTVYKELKVPASTGDFSLSLPAGSYTLQVKDQRRGIGDNDRYSSVTENVTVKAGETVTKNLYVGQAADSEQIRIVLTWGQYPSDLDSHLFGPAGDGTGRFHTAYYSKVYNYNKKKYADLDLDDVTSYGPETTTIYHRSGVGKYSFYVHDFSNGGRTSCNAMGNSGAKVCVYMGSILMKTFNITPGAYGTLWHVFDYDAGTGEVINVNKMGYSGSRDFDTICGSDDSATESEEQSDINTIINNEVPK